MKVYKRGRIEVTKVEFCCKNMAESVLLGGITTSAWTDHPLYFDYRGLILKHCPFCGAKIQGGIQENE